MYPTKVVRKIEEGTPSVSFKLTATGELIDIKIVKLSGSTILDNAALKAVSLAKVIGPKPTDIADNQIVELRFKNN